MTPDPNLFRPAVTPPAPSSLDVYSALDLAWKKRFGLHNGKALALLMAHQALETGWWKHMPCYNMGGMRPSDVTQPWTSYATFEVMAENDAKTLVKNSTQEAPCSLGDVQASGKVMVHCYPRHPASIFRAFGSLAEGAEQYLTVLYERFGKVWTPLLAGDPDNFVKALKDQGYFSADLGPYENAIQSIYRTILKLHVEPANNSDRPEGPR